MSSIASSYANGLLRFSCHGKSSHHHAEKISASWTMTTNFNFSKAKSIPESLIEVQKLSRSQSDTTSSSSLQFDQLQPLNQPLILDKKIEFGQFVTREAILDEEYRTAAWLRAESHWEDQSNDRYFDNNKRKFADQEFIALKRQCNAQFGQKCTCFVTVKKEDKNVKRTVLKSVVGTLDLSIRYSLDGQTFPGERVKAPLFCSINKQGRSKYGYIANLCVAKSARRQGIATNMLHLAILTAKSEGVKNVFVHVHRYNESAQNLYLKIGFEVVEIASHQFSDEETCLLCVGT